MPDPLTSADIEDVLGSIRRLVSEEAAAKAKKGGEADKLVLTPAYRVGEPESPKDAPLKLGEPVSDAAAGPGLAEELANLEASVSETAERWRDEDLQSPAEEAGSEAVEPQTAAEAAAAEAKDPEPTEEEAAAEAAEPEPVEEDQAAGVVEPEPVEEDAVEPEPATEASAADADIAETEAQDTASEAEALAAVGEDPIPEAEDFAIGEEDPAAEAAGPEGEDLIAERDDSGAYDAWEPAGEEGQPGFRGVEAGGAETVLEEPPIEAEVVRLAAAPSLPEAPENVAKPDVESLLDEAELRALVAEVLREELKGPLGERITRNVRKLVRREIAQALSSMDID